MGTPRDEVQSWIAELEQERDPLVRLQAIHALKLELSPVNEAMRQAFLAAKEQGRTLAEIAEAMGMDRAEAEEKFAARSA